MSNMHMENGFGTFSCDLIDCFASFCLLNLSWIEPYGERFMFTSGEHSLFSGDEGIETPNYFMNLENIITMWNANFIVGVHTVCMLPWTRQIVLNMKINAL